MAGPGQDEGRVRKGKRRKRRRRKIRGRGRKGKGGGGGGGGKSRGAKQHRIRGRGGWGGGKGVGEGRRSEAIGDPCFVLGSAGRKSGKRKRSGSDLGIRDTETETLAESFKCSKDLEGK